MIRRSLCLLTLAIAGVLFVSQPAEAAGPLMVDVDSYYDNGVVIFYGKVFNAHPGQAVKVSFGTLFTATITANPNGSFHFERDLPPGTSGTTSVVAKQGSDISSPDYTYVYVP